MQRSRVPFRAVAALVAVVSFAILLARGRPVGGQRGVEPLLFASGLHQPRGLAFTADGELLVAEAGVSGDGQAAAPGRVLRFDAAGRPSVLVDNLPAASSLDSPFQAAGPGPIASQGGRPSYVFVGPADEAPLGTLQRLREVEGRWRLEPALTLTLDGAASQAPAAGPAAVWDGAFHRDGALYATLPLPNVLLRLTPGGAGDASPAAGWTASKVTGFIGPGQRNPLPTAVATAPDGALLVALFGTEPFRAGAGRIVRVEADGRWQPLYEGLNFPVALGFGRDGQLFALELASGFDPRRGQFAPRSGRLLAVGPSPARRRIVVREVHYPTAMAFLPTGDVYFTEGGVLTGAGEGRVLRVPAQTLLTLR